MAISPAPAGASPGSSEFDKVNGACDGAMPSNPEPIRGLAALSWTAKIEGRCAGGPVGDSADAVCMFADPGPNFRKDWRLRRISYELSNTCAEEILQESPGQTARADEDMPNAFHV
jgi:hypothetical protein